jgi:hypothetical protein
LTTGQRPAHLIVRLDSLAQNPERGRNGQAESGKKTAADPGAFHEMASSLDSIGNRVLCPRHRSRIRRRKYLTGRRCAFGKTDG